MMASIVDAQGRLAPVVVEFIFLIVGFVWVGLLIQFITPMDEDD